ncbi:hypothetical protein K490DRAFT_48338 [Saccharata proteae CBS 121410]|uniref:Alpha/beta hydrolase fold-3 domain-containing protein n=1 Tax=Saccharata proteae CBS 121410 TaxID=1314787 RepID=A0A9P4HRU9_9PEZI|nr:hypothetical protein K490DRAFT_48338 [Saccharata proteae CBS 121410]
MDGTNNIVGIAKFIVPKVPLLLKSALFHSLYLSHTSSKLDLKSELIIQVVRSELCKPATSSITKQQRLLNKDHPVKGNLWVSRATLPAPEDDVRALLCRAIDDLKVEGDEAYTIPETKPVEGEWHGHRANCAANAPEPAISEEEKYKNLLQETTGEGVVLYFHGGAYYLMDPASHRPTTSKYARLLGGRVFSVRYRLAPQNPFPAGLLDALIAYLSLLYPPPGSLHSPVPADKIIFGGDSAGGNLAIVLLQAILQIHRSTPSGSTPTVSFHGKEVAVPLPAGLALSSPWTDITRSMPSIDRNARYDYLPPASSSADSRFPPDAVWPTTPPRADLYCEGTALCHPLVSPLAARDWTGAPPVLFMVGEEMMADESMVVARRMAAQGVKVLWRQYEAMPHCFALMLEGNASAERCFEDWTGFAKAVVEGRGVERTEGKWVVARSLEDVEVDVGKLTELTDDEVERLMKEARAKRLMGLEGEAKVQPRL